LGRGRVERSIEIKAPPGRVWEMLALDRQVEWMDKFKSAEYTSEVRTPKDKYRVGASGHMNIKGLGEFDFEVTESLENEKMTYHQQSVSIARGLGIETLILEPVEEGTKFTYVHDYFVPWGILDKLWAKRAGEKWLERSLEKLKSILEK